jgi:hypothetical protein
MTPPAPSVSLISAHGPPGTGTTPRSTFKINNQHTVGIRGFQDRQSSAPHPGEPRLSDHFHGR